MTKAKTPAVETPVVPETPTDNPTEPVVSEDGKTITLPNGTVITHS